MTISISLPFSEKLLGKDQHGREVKESSPEILGNSRIFCPNKGTEVDSWKTDESFSWQNSLWWFEFFMTLSSLETII